MKSPFAKILILVLFLTLLLGSAYWLYSKFVKDRPVITIEENRTSFDRVKADSAIKAQQGYRR